jgi:hypothetical protein
MKIELNHEELAELIHICETQLAETRVEVRRTSTPDFHDELVAKRDLIEHMLEKLRHPQSR